MIAKAKKTSKTVLLLVSLEALLLAALFAVAMNTVYAADAEEIEYTFETVPIESIDIVADNDSTEMQPRQSFTVSYAIRPWYTTTSRVVFDIEPRNAASVTFVSPIAVEDGTAEGYAQITVADTASVGDVFTVTAGADAVTSNPLVVNVAKIPVEKLSLSVVGSDTKLHVGKSRAVECSIMPDYATVQDVRYTLSGTGLPYIESFDESTGVIKAKSDIAVLDVNSTVTITAYSVDDPNIYDSVTLSLYLPATVVELSASTPLGRTTPDGEPWAVADTKKGDTINLSTKVNGVEISGLAYSIVKGQEYVENGTVQPGGEFTLRPTSSWSQPMQTPHPEVKIRATYSDGFDEITVFIYVPVERLSFINSVPAEVENYRSYDVSIEAFPKYATQLADKEEPFVYSLNGTDASVAQVTSAGILSLPKSLTSKGSVIQYAASLKNAWEGVDAAPLTHELTVVPVYATAFQSITILKDGLSISSANVRVMPSDTLQVVVEYTMDNVTDVAVTLRASSNMLSVSGQSIYIESLRAMETDTPYIEIGIQYTGGGQTFETSRGISIYVPAESAEIADAEFMRDKPLNLNELVTINGHGYASNKTIYWGDPVLLNGKNGLSASCENGILRISSQANAGTIARVPYRTYDGVEQQYKEFIVAPLSGRFTLEYGKTKSDSDAREYEVDYDWPQLEDGQHVDLILKFNGVGAADRLGLSYSVRVSDNALFDYLSGDFECDIFRLQAKSGQSGRNTAITYSISAIDGTETYYIYTVGSANSGTSPNDLILNRISIFNRISGAIGVSNVTIAADGTFDLTNWDEKATFHKEDLSWNITGGILDGSTIKNAPDSGFILTISASQKYNKEEIAFSVEIPYYSVLYYKESSIVKRLYVQSGSPVTLEGRICTKAGYIQTGWSSKNDGSNEYPFYSVYGGNQDLTLYAYWVQISETLMIHEEKTLDENQNEDVYTGNYRFSALQFDTLRALGYTQVEIEISAVLQRTNSDGAYAHLWLDMDEERVYTNGYFQPSSDKSVHTYTVTVDISKFENNSAIRLGFYTSDDGVWGKFTWKFYSAAITFTAKM